MYSFNFDVISRNNSKVSLSNSVVNDVLLVDVVKFVLGGCV